MATLPSSREIVRGLCVVALFCAALYLLWRIREVVGLVAMAAFFAVAISPLVNVLDRSRWIPRPLAILLSYIAILLVVFGLGALLVPPVVDEINEGVRVLPNEIREIRDSETFREYDERYGIVAELEKQASRLPSLLSDAAGELEQLTVGVFKTLGELIVVLVVAFFLLLYGPRIRGFALQRLPEDRRARADALILQGGRAIGGYVAGVFCIALAAGVVSFAMMEILGIPFAIPLAVFMGLCALVPLIGSAIGAVAIAIVAAFQGIPELVIWVVFFICYQQFESHVIGPQVYKRTLHMNPLIAILAVLAGAALLDILGALLAIPVAALIQIVVLDWWRLRRPDPADRSSPPGETPAAGAPAR